MMPQHQRVFPRRVCIGQAVAQREFLEIAAQVQDLLELRPAGCSHAKPALVQPVNKLIGRQKAERLANGRCTGIERDLEGVDLQTLPRRDLPGDDFIPEREIDTPRRGLR